MESENADFMIEPDDILEIKDENAGSKEEATEEVIALKRQIECLHDLMSEYTT